MKRNQETIRDIAFIVSDYLRIKGIDAVLVGGACVSIYSNNKYQSYDLDMVADAPLRVIERILSEIGFTRTAGRLFKKKGCDFVIDFVAPPLAIGQDPVAEVQILKKRTAVLKLLTPTDCVRDRLAAYYYWNDPQSLEQAVMVAKKQKSAIRLPVIKKWSAREDNLTKYNVFIKKIKTRKDAV